MAFKSSNIVNEREYEVISEIALKVVLEKDFADRILINSLVAFKAVD